jgi:hypothetical protein
MESKRKPIADAREIRREQTLRRLGTRDPECPHCGERDPAALTGIAPDIICYGCLAAGRGQPTSEDHHYAGRRNDELTVPAPANDHRVLNDLQRDWPERTLRNPDESPLLASAAAVRGFLDILQVIIERMAVWIPVFLEWLDEELRRRHGDRWWETFGWKGTGPAR